MADAFHQPVDFRAQLPAGRVMTRAIEDALFAATAVNGGAPLSAPQLAALLGPPVPFPATIPRMPGEGCDDGEAVRSPPAAVDPPLPLYTPSTRGFDAGFDAGFY